VSNKIKRRRNVCKNKSLGITGLISNNEKQNDYKNKGEIK
jgi:hypothetical protein